MNVCSFLLLLSSYLVFDASMLCFQLELSWCMIPNIVAYCLGSYLNHLLAIELYNITTVLYDSTTMISGISTLWF